MELQEAPVNNNKRAEVGTVSHKSTWDDDHVKKALAYAAKVTGKSEEDIKSSIQKDIDEIKELETKSPILYATASGNIIESSLYKFFREHKLENPPGVAKFNPVTFSALVRRIKAENPSFFPLRNFFNRKPIASPRMILVPTSRAEDKKWNDIDTAAATPNGEFIFNVDCMQRDMNFAYVQGIKAKSKKYKSNGGEFPDEWAPVEFTIMHEFYHYTHGDFHFGKVMGGSPQIHNWVGDFRSNYDLQKAGYHPYAEGLFNDLVNYDRQTSYKEMYDVVEAEFKKLSPQEQKKIEKYLGDLGDNHDAHHQGEEPRTGDTPSMEDMEKHGKKVTSQLDNKKDGEKSEQGTTSGGKGPGGRAAGGNPEKSAIDYSKIKPRHNWKQLIERFVRSSDELETTYQKMHKRNVTGIHLALQTGVGAVRPGEKIVPASLVKLVFVVDSSGSMHEQIAKVMANVEAASREQGVSKSFLFVEFSNDFTFYLCTSKGNGSSAVEIDATSLEPKGKQLSLNDLLSHHIGGATNFSDSLVSHLKALCSKKYNVVVMSDSDLASGANLEELMNLYKHSPQQVGAIFDSKSTYASVIQGMKGAPATFTYFD